MKLAIAGNIRTFRKERRLTQEQLAEVLGVTVGAVSKWESGLSMPDVSLIVEMASFFETSVDVLLGYEWHKGRMADAISGIKQLRNERKFDEAASLAEKTLQQYPNSFDAVFNSAVLYSIWGVETSSERAYRRSLELFTRALELIDQNTNEHINEWTVRNNIASVYLGLGQVDEALEQLKKNNAASLNDGDIGFTLAVSKRMPDEALPYLSNALISHLTEIFRIIIGYANAYGERRELKNSLFAMQWMESLISSLCIPGKNSYFTKESIVLLTGCAKIAADMEDKAAVLGFLSRAKDAAAAYDLAPDSTFNNTRFFHGGSDMTGFDSFGSTATEGIPASFSDEDDRVCGILEAAWQELNS